LANIELRAVEERNTVVFRILFKQLLQSGQEGAVVRVIRQRCIGRRKGATFKTGEVKLLGVAESMFLTTCRYNPSFFLPLPL
jgi:hypothetical protein